MRYIFDDQPGERIAEINMVHLSDSELTDGCELLMDSGADTCVAGKHAWISERIEGVTVSARGFSDSLPIVENLPIVNAIYAYDNPLTGEVILLEMNYSIYLGDNKTDSIACPNQMRLNGIYLNDLPRALYPEVETAQTIIADELSMPLHFNGPLAYLNVRRPIASEVSNTDLQRIELTSPHGWDPYGVDSLSDSNQQSRPLHVCPVSTFLSNALRSLSIINTSKNRTITPEDLMRRWGIGIDTARRTLRSTYQEYTRSADNLSRRFKTARVHSRYRQLTGPYSQFYMDTLFSKVVSIRGNTCGQVYFNKAGFWKFYPLRKKEDVHTTLPPLIELAGIPNGMHSDRAPELIKGRFSALLSRYRIRQTTTESSSPWQNQAEGQGVKKIKKLGLWLLQKNNAPMRVWDYAFEMAANILTFTSNPHILFGDQTGYQIITQLKPDISQYASFDFYAWVWHWDEISKQKKPGRWLGVAETVGPIMTFWILPISGIPIPRSTVVKINKDEFDDMNVKAIMDDFTNTIKIKLGNISRYSITQDQSIPFRKVEQASQVSDLWDGDIKMIPYEPTSEESAMEQLDEFIGSQIPLETKEGPVLVKVVSRKRDHSGNLIGTRHTEPTLDTRLYTVKFPDGHFEEYSSNVLSESLTVSVDDYGYDKGYIQEICGHRSSSKAVDKRNGYIHSSNGNKIPKITTKGWEICVRWKDLSKTWVPLNVFKNNEPLLLAEYAKTMGIDTEPAFNWWVSHTLRKKSRLLSKLKTLYHKTNLKFGLEVPRSIAHAHAIDSANGNHFWRDAIEKEMTNVKIAFRFLDENLPPPVGHTRINCHIIFDVKMDLTRKARFVAGGHMTDPPTSMTYASVVSRDSVRIAFLLAALNDCNILSGDIGNAYLNAFTTEKIYYRAGLEWGEAMKGRVIVIVRALYGLKTSANAWRTHLCTTLHNDMGFQYSYADNDVWMKPDVKPDGTEYYTYILIYVDDILIVSDDPSRYMKQLQSAYYVKETSIGPPKLYLGAEIKKVRDRTGKMAWASSSSKYVREATAVIETRMKEMNLTYTKSAKSPRQPFSNVKYRPELDVSVVCDAVQHQFYQQMVGILRWMIELGRLDISTEVSLMSRYLAQPRMGHLIQVLHMFSYLKSNQCLDICYDPTKLEINEPTTLPQERAQHRANIMKTMYPDAIDLKPANMPAPRGKSIQINAFVDADLAGESTTRRSQTGIIIYGNMAPLMTFSKRQNTVEASTFGAEFVAMRVLVEMLIGLRYKLRMFGIPLDGPCNVFCDNEAVTKSTMRAESTLKKKHISIAYHQAREAVAGGIMLVFYERTKSNHADLFTKVLNHIDRKRLMGYICGKSDIPISPQTPVTPA